MLSDRFPLCLQHQLPENQSSAYGLVCARCKQRLYTEPPQGRCMNFWESQPMAYSLDREPCFVYTLMWDDYRIRSLHGPNSESDARSEKLRTRYEKDEAGDIAGPYLSDSEIDYDRRENFDDDGGWWDIEE